MTKAELIAEIEGFQKQVAELKRKLDLREEGNLDLGLKSPPHGRAGQADSTVSDKTSEHTKTVATPIPVLLAYVDAGQRLQFNNLSYGEWFGRQRQNAWGKHIRKVLGETTYRKILPRVKAALAGEKQAFEVEVPGPNGETRILETHYVPHLGENGTVLGFDATVLDITERKKAEQAIQESELRLSEILDVAKEAIISVDEEQKIVLFNKGAERIFGSKAQEAIGQRLPGPLIASIWKNFPKALLILANCSREVKSSRNGKMAKSSRLRLQSHKSKLKAGRFSPFFCETLQSGNRPKPNCKKVRPNSGTWWKPPRT